MFLMVVYYLILPTRCSYYHTLYFLNNKDSVLIGIRDVDKWFCIILRKKSKPIITGDDNILGNSNSFRHRNILVGNSGTSLPGDDSVRDISQI